MNTTAAVERLKRSEEKKASMPRKMKVESKLYSQAELIALALDNEEGNIVDHRDYLKVEEEKRRRARVVRASIEGPLVRWISRREDEKVVIPPPPAPTVPSTQRFAYTPYTMGSLPYSQMTPYTYSAGVYPHMAGYMSSYSVPNTAPTSVMTGLGSGTPTSFQSSTPLKPPPAPSTEKVTLHQTTKKTVQSTQIVAQPVTEPISVPTASQNAPTGTTSTTTQSTTKSTPPPPATDAMPQVASQSTLKPVPQQATQPPSQNTSSATTHYNPYMAHLQSTTAMKWTPPPAPTPTERIEKVAKSYVVHELAQDTSAPKPSWNETMSAMFGDDIKWDEIKVYSGKNRPLSRPKQICPITGNEAKYLDPRTGVPYADVRAYEVLTKLLAHEYAWHPSFGCYVGQDEAGANRATSES
ncbi:hypothetical protein H0H93_005012 [Arthromyces matolae]|nr:hypothetical protein H0H93_005012 [Arthromyces matolae]